jgi:hypothetical protein
VLVLEELGSDTHVIFPIDAPRVEAEDHQGGRDDEEERLILEDRAVWNAPGRGEDLGKGRLAAAARGRHGALYFFDPASGASLAVADLATVST